MHNQWQNFVERYPMPPVLVVVAGIIGVAIVDKFRDWVLTKAMATPYLLPLLLIAGGGLWFYYIVHRLPRFDIICEPSHHPYRQEWDDSGGHQVLFRVAVKNLSKTRAINRAEVRLTAIQPFAIPCIPARLLLMNEAESVREFFLPPEGLQYVDIVQQNQPRGNLFLWHTVNSQGKEIPAQNYTITVTALGDNAEPVSRQFYIHREGTVYALTPRIDKS